MFVVPFPTAESLRPTAATYPGSNYTEEEVDFFKAIQQYKEVRHRPFPTWGEVLQVVHALGYRRPGFDGAGKKIAAPGVE